MLKIERINGGNDGPTLHLEGRVIGPWVGVLRRTCEPDLAAGRGLALDLSHVTFLDWDAVDLLRSLRDRQVALLNCSPFVAEQLKA